MITKTYINKFCTIIKNSDLNTGLNPISDLTYGASNTRALCYFDHSKLQELVKNNICPDMSKFKHILHITNAGSLDLTELHDKYYSNITDSIKLRATSFDLIFFLIPELWDNGKGFDFTKTFFNQGYYGKECKSKVNVDSSKLISTDGCNWYQSRNGYKWKEEGIYSNDTLAKEYDLFSSEEGSEIIIGRQHFDIGNENISLDITDIVNKFIDGKLENYGIGIAYTPQLERTDNSEIENYLGLVTHKTNTYFAPYVETYYDDVISDDRNNFVLDKDNKVYLYCNIGGKLTDLDEMPTCKVNEVEYEVKQATKGVYYIDINLSSKEYQPKTMIYDVWGNIKFNGAEFDDIEMEIVTKPNTDWFKMTSSIINDSKVTPTIYGIDDKEHIKRGDIRRLGIQSKKNYTTNTSVLMDDIYVRIYIKDGTRELDALPWQKVNKTTDENFIMIDTNIFIPQQYFIDVKVKYDVEEIIHHNLLTFKITDDLNNKYC